MSQLGKKEIKPRWMILETTDERNNTEVYSYTTFLELCKYFYTKPSDTHVAVVYGVQAHLTKPPKGSDRRYLIHPDGRAFPLFKELEIEISPDGYLGEDDEAIDYKPSRRPLESLPSGAAEEDQIDEEEEEEDPDQAADSDESEEMPGLL